MNTTPNKVRITYGSNNGRGRYYNSNKIKTALLPSMPSLPNKNELNNNSSLQRESNLKKKDVFDFNPDHDDFEARQLQRQRQRMNVTSGKNISSTYSKSIHSTPSLLKKKSIGTLDIISPVKIKKTNNNKTSTPKKSQNTRSNANSQKKKSTEKKQDEPIEIIDKPQGPRNLRARSHIAGKPIEVIDLLEENNNINDTKKRKLPEKEEASPPSLTSSKKNKTVEEKATQPTLNPSKSEPIPILKSKHNRSDSLDSSSSLTSLSSLPTIPSSPEVIEIDDEPIKKQKIHPSTTKTTPKEEVIEIFSDTEKNTTTSNPTPKITYKRKINTNINRNNGLPKRITRSNSLLKKQEKEDEDDDVIIIDDSKAKPISNKRNTSFVSYQSPYMRKSMSVSDYNRLRRQRLLAQAMRRSYSQQVKTGASSLYSSSQPNPLSIYDNKTFEVSNSTFSDDTMLDLESNNYKMEALEETFTSSSTPKIPRTATSSSITYSPTLEGGDSSSPSDEEGGDEDSDMEIKFSSLSSSIDKSQSLSCLPESRVGRMKSSHLKKSKSFGAIYDSGASTSYREEDSISSNLNKIPTSKGEKEEGSGDDEESSSLQSNSLQRSISSLSYFSEPDNKKDKGT